MKPKRLNWRVIQTGFILLCTFILIIGVKAQVVTDGLVSYYTLDKRRHRWRYGQRCRRR